MAKKKVVTHITYKRWWQDEAVTKHHGIFKDGGIGQLILPTGTGKTRIAMKLIDRHRNIHNRNGVYCVFVPRLLLSTQWLQEFGNYFMGRYDSETNQFTPTMGVPVKFVLASTVQPDKEVKEAISGSVFALTGKPVNEGTLKITTGIKEIEDTVNKFKSDPQNIVVIIGTYHSSERVAKASESFQIDATFYDEAHYMTSSDDGDERKKFEFAHDVNTLSKLFMTATPRYTSDKQNLIPDSNARGMQNESLYGSSDNIYTKSPKEMVDAGAIVSPEVFLIEKDHVDDSGKSDIRYCWEAISKALEVGKENHPRIGSKVLVTMDGQERLMGMFDDKQNIEIIKQKFPNLKIYALSSDFGVYIDGQKHDASNRNKDRLLLELKRLSSDDDAVIIHVNMISEGIDVPGINVVLPFSYMNKSKALQVVGRATRTHPEDSCRIFEKQNLNPSNSKEFIKPNAIVCLPMLWNDDEDDVTEYTDLLFALKEEYGFDPKEILTVKINKGIAKPTSSFPFSSKAKKVSRKLAESIEQLHVEHLEGKHSANMMRWSKCIASLTCEELKKFLKYCGQENRNMLISSQL